MNTANLISYYIDRIEKSLKTLKISLDNHEYNSLFELTDEQEFRQKLMSYNNQLNKLLDERES